MITEEILARRMITMMVHTKPRERAAMIRTVSERIRIDGTIVHTFLHNLIRDGVVKSEMIEGKEIISLVKKPVSKRVIPPSKKENK